MSKRGRILLGVAIAVGIGVRVFALDRLPGINGDEAWFGADVMEFLRGGEPFYRTPSGNLVNPIHTGALLLFSLVLDPSTAVLRAPSALWGSLAVIVAYPLLAKPIGSTAALIVTLLVAVSPAAVIQSRLGWDPSATPLFTLIAVAGALRGHLAWTVLAGTTAIVVHPTNIFLGPILAAALAPGALTLYRNMDVAARRRVWAAAALGAILGVLVIAAVSARLAHSGQLPSIEMVLARVVSPAQWLASAEGALALFSGVPSAVFVAGPIPAGIASTVLVAVALLMVLPLVYGMRQLLSGARPHSLASWLIVGMAASLTAFHAVAGPGMFQPGYERYALFLIVPAAIVFALAADACGRYRPVVMVLTTAAMCLFTGGLLVVGYFWPLLTRGGDGHQTFRTGDREPKAAAFAFLRDDSRAAQNVTVLAENWWVYWPIRYLGANDSQRIHIEAMPEASMPGGVRAQGADAPTDRSVSDKSYAVVFDGSEAWQRVSTQGRTVFTAVDMLGRPILHVVEIPPGADQRPNR